MTPDDHITTSLDFTTHKENGEHSYVLESGDRKMGLKNTAKVRGLIKLEGFKLMSRHSSCRFTQLTMPGFVGKGVYGNHSGLCLLRHGFSTAINQGKS